MIYNTQKSLESVTHITEKELNLFMYFLRYSHHSTEMLWDVPGTLCMKKDFLFWILANHSRDNLDGPKSDRLNLTKETQRFPESRPSLHFYFFFCETLIQGSQ